MAEPALKVETDDDWSMSDRRERSVMRQSESMSDIPEERPFPSTRGKLTKAEIEALLRPDLPENLDELSEPPTDRAYSDFDSQAYQSSSRDEEDARVIAAAISLGSVSYTHLTLPTICSV